MMATEPPNEPTFRTIDLSAEVKRLYGPKWNEPELEYEFGDGKRKFKRRTADSGIYKPQD